MGARREGREAAVQYFYQRDLSGEKSPESLSDFYAIRNLSPSARKFCTKLVQGISEHQENIDKKIQGNAKNYDINRLSAVDRNILRLAIFEITECPDVPPAVSINEAIEIAKKYSTEDSGRFVNGILDQIRKELKRLTS
ncbi:MAG: transcription antitermination factor NusB [Chthoniobacterales bacterium]